ncbi:MAG: PAS domain-containing protein [Bdellovibrio sp.]|nr:PAS domain-containing protein [Methylotenera sp.]
MPNDLMNNISDHLTATRWRTLKLYNIYRLLITLLLLITQGLIVTSGWQHTLIAHLFIDTFSTLVSSYFIFSVIATIFTWQETPDIHLSVPLQIITDIVFIVLLMHAQEGGQGSIGLLLIIAIASASLISDGRLALFYAALASIGMLLAQTYRVWFFAGTAESYTPAVLLSLGCFATAWLAYSLAKRTKESELLASQRGLDVQNMAQINALITHEMQDGVLVVNPDFVIKHYNTQAEKLLGLEAKNWQGDVLNNVSPEINQLLQDWLDETKLTKAYAPSEVASPSFMPNFIKLSTQSRELRLRFLPIADNQKSVNPYSNNNYQGAVIFIEDWSQMQTQAHQVKLAALGRLTANIAHEIRNPLSAISHANQLLQEEEFNPASKRMLQIIADNVQRVDQIIKDVLELNRRDRTNQEPIVLENFILDFYTQFCAVEKIPATCFKLTLINAETTVSFDRRHLNQILWNLCKNGWRHCKKLENSLELSLNLTDKTKAIHIKIEDDGDGVPESIRNHLFEPFFTTEKSGTGLGLYIARELADANGAKLEFEAVDSAISSGSIFTVHINKV